jgi:hypothetical protein
MTDSLRRFLVVGLLALLAGTVTLAFAACVPGIDGPGFLSPVSPVAALPWAEASEPAWPFSRILSRSFWTSPLPWMAIGLVFFSVFAGALIQGLLYARPEQKRKESGGPSEWGP